MKMKFIVFILSFLGVALAVFLFVRIGEKIMKSNKKITNLSRLHFSYSTGNYMDASVSYDLECEGDKCTFYFKDDGVARVDRMEYPISKETVSQIEDYFNQIHLGTWDGFQKTDLHVLDGNSFDFSIHFGEGESIYASGYEKWPKNYGEVKGFLISTFEECMKKS